MIKVIEEGKEEFIMICDRCGCKFSYQLNDLGRDTDGLTLCSKENQVRCPYCGEWHYHPHQDPQKQQEVDYWYKHWNPIPTDINDKIVNDNYNPNLYEELMFAYPKKEELDKLIETATLAEFSVDARGNPYYTDKEGNKYLLR